MTRLASIALFGALLLRGEETIERLIDTGRLDEARARLRTANVEAPRRSVLEAMMLYREGKSGEALGVLRPLLDSGSASADARKLAALALVSLGRSDEAGVHIREAVRLKPGDFMARYYLGLHQLDKRQFEEAATTFEEATRLSPDYPDAHTMLGLAREQLGHDNDAVASYRKAVELTARLRLGKESAYVYLGRFLNNRGRNDEASGQLETAVRVNGRSAEAWLLLGKVRSALARHSEAIAALRRAAELAPRDKRVRFQMMQTYQRMGLAEEARREREIYESMSGTELKRWEEAVSR